jgi:hypothetical protein
MAEFVHEIDNERNIYPNMTVYKRYLNDEFSGWAIIANDGYVIYDTTANNTELNPETMEEVPVIYYYTATYKNPRYNWDNFHYVAVLRSTVDENYIFGGGNNNNSEIM